MVKLFCQKFFYKTFYEIFCQISCIVRGKTVWPATCGKYCEFIEKLLSFSAAWIEVKKTKTLCVCMDEENVELFV